MLAIASCVRALQYDYKWRDCCYGHTAPFHFIGERILDEIDVLAKELKLSLSFTACEPPNFNKTDQ